MVILSTTILELIPYSNGVPVVQVSHIGSIYAHVMARNPGKTTVIIDRHRTSVTPESTSERMADAEMGTSLNPHRSVEIARLAHGNGSPRAEAAIRFRLHTVDDTVVASIVMPAAVPVVARSLDMMAPPARHRNQGAVQMPLMIGVVATITRLVRALTSTVMPNPVPEAIQAVIAMSVESYVVYFASESYVVPLMAAASVDRPAPMVHVEVESAHIALAATSSNFSESIMVVMMITEIERVRTVRAIELLVMDAQTCFRRLQETHLRVVV
jgi:hypothetical protein